MRKVRFTAIEFETFLFPAVATATAEDVQQMDAAAGVIRKLKDPHKTDEIPLSETERAARERGQNVYAFRKLKCADYDSFSFVEEEWGFLVAVLTKNRVRVALLALDDYDAMVENVTGATNEEEEQAQ